MCIRAIDHVGSYKIKGVLNSGLGDSLTTCFSRRMFAGENFLWFFYFYHTNFLTLAKCMAHLSWGPLDLDFQWIKTHRSVNLYVIRHLFIRFLALGFCIGLLSSQFASKTQVLARLGFYFSYSICTASIFSLSLSDY